MKTSLNKPKINYRLSNIAFRISKLAYTCLTVTHWTVCLSICLQITCGDYGSALFVDCVNRFVLASICISSGQREFFLMYVCFYVFFFHFLCLFQLTYYFNDASFWNGECVCSIPPLQTRPIISGTQFCGVFVLITCNRIISGLY